MTILKDLERINALFNSLPPVPVCIWIIDSPHEYYRIKNIVQAGFKNTELWPGSMFGGLPIMETSAQEIENKIKAGLSQDREDMRESFRGLLDSGQIYPFREKGVWVQMNKGNHYRLVDNQLLPVGIIVLDKDDSVGAYRAHIAD